MSKPRFIRNKKTGTFAGSIGVGKIETPTAAPQIPVQISEVPKSENITFGLEFKEPITSKPLEGFDQSVEEVEDFIFYASNPEITHKQSMEIASHQHTRVRYALASNPRTAPDALYVLSFDKEPAVRVRVASNPNTPIRCVKVLSTDLNWAVLDALRGNFKLRKRFLDDKVKQRQHSVSVENAEQDRFLVTNDIGQEPMEALRGVGDVSLSFRAKTENALLRSRDVTTREDYVLDASTGISIFDMGEE